MFFIPTNRWIFLLATLGLLTSPLVINCGDSSFSGGTPKASTPPKKPEPKEEEPKPKEEEPEEPEPKETLPDCESNVSIALVVDTSYSMESGIQWDSCNSDMFKALPKATGGPNTKIAYALGAISNFVQGLSKGDEIGLAKFSDKANQIEAVTTKHKEVLNKLTTEHLLPEACTNVTAALDMGEKMLAPKKGDKKKVLLLLSDGEPSKGGNNEAVIERADKIKKSGDITIITVGYGLTPKGRELMKDVSTDEKYYIDAQNKSSIAKAFKNVRKKVCD